jgi:hypothetical protein
VLPVAICLCGYAFGEECADEQSQGE